MTGSLYDRLGGLAAIEAAVGVFYKRIISDPELSPFFEGVDMRKQERKQMAFMTYVFGGAGEYQGRDLAAAHKRLILEKGLNEGHFDKVAVHLEETLRSLGVPEDLVGEAMTIVATAKPAIFGSA
ncbi:hypothetical protein GPECTOR_11g222 [Gonium pectorale]|uniref:Group 1 truncated hemoglobin n=1 Tax=Gonium pectorale TaxID=33097 RepID=A0A150GPM3_GONPE|nr:hypothetical protein GPECTOR_11g222 [Gonium pectorale]|eukprot:KXZ51779.1 hypothetical protein GPECTOR_11g222 [Gonium pectorale]